MVKIVRRARELQSLLKLRLGGASAILSPSVSRIHLDIGMEQYEGNQGAKQFWKRYLTTLKYHNPTIPMTVAKAPDSTCQMTISFTPPSTSEIPNPTPASSPATTSKIIPMALRSRQEILNDVFAATSAQRVEQNPAEVREFALMNEEYIQIGELRKKNKVLLDEIKREKDILRKAMGDMGVQKRRRGKPVDELA